MKLGKFDFCKIKKITAIEIIVLVLFFVALGIYYTPKFLSKNDIKMIAKIKADNAMFTAKVLEEFSSNKKAIPSEVAKKIVEEFNAAGKNPYNKDGIAYTFEQNCKACNKVTYDDKFKTITIESFDKKGAFIARTIIAPPSFVTYVKEVK